MALRPELLVVAEVVLMEVGFDDPRVADAVDGDLLAFDCLAFAGGRPVDKRFDLFTVRHGICHPANQDINPVIYSCYETCSGLSVSVLRR